MSNTLHQTLEGQRPHPAPAIRPSILATFTYLFLLFVAWVYFMVMSTPRSFGAIDASVLTGGQAAGTVLIAWVGLDAWRERLAAGRFASATVGVLAILTLAAAIWLLRAVAGLAP